MSVQSYTNLGTCPDNEQRIASWIAEGDMAGFDNLNADFYQSSYSVDDQNQGSYAYNEGEGQAKTYASSVSSFLLFHIYNIYIHIYIYTYTLHI